MTFMIATTDELQRGLRTSSFDDANRVPDPGTRVVVSLPEKGTHAIAEVESVDADGRVVYLAVDEDSRVWV